MWIPFKSSSCGRKESKVTLPGESCGESGTVRRELKWRRERELRGVDAEAQGTEAQGDRVSGEQSSMHLKTGNTDEQLGGRCDI